MSRLASEPRLHVVQRWSCGGASRLGWPLCRRQGFCRGCWPHDRSCLRVVRILELHAAVAIVIGVVRQQGLGLAMARGFEPARIDPVLVDEILPGGFRPLLRQNAVVLGTT